MVLHLEAADDLEVFEAFEGGDEGAVSPGDFSNEEGFKVKVEVGGNLSPLWGFLES